MGFKGGQIDPPPPAYPGFHPTRDRVKRNYLQKKQINERMTMWKYEINQERVKRYKSDNNCIG